MNALGTACAVEVRKAAASRVLGTATILLAAGIALLAGSLTWAANSGNEQVLAQLGTMADRSGWLRLTGVAAQVTAAGGLLGFGVVLSWMFGREFTDGTIAGLFALPVSRPAIATAKLATCLLWALLVATVLVLTIAAAGFVLGLGPLTAEALAALGRQYLLTLLSACLATPAAWASTAGRGALPGIATTIGIIVVAQIMAIAGTSAWFPFAAPALWALHPAPVQPVQLALAAIIPIVSTVVIGLAWRRLQLDR